MRAFAKMGFAFAFALVAVSTPFAGARSAPEPMKPVDLRLQGLCADVALGDPEISVWSQTGRATDLTSRLRRSRVVVLGEIHDNALHHRIQACLLAAFAADRTPGVVWEQFSETQSDALTEYWATLDRTAAGVGPAVGWDKTGWPKWSEYEPIAAVALSRNLPLYAGNAERSRVMDVARKGFETLPGLEARALQVLEPLSGPENAALLDVLVASHCDLMPTHAFGGMAKAQNFRDAWMARVVGHAVATHGGAALITGNGHVHKFRGVPLYLERQSDGLAPDDILTVMAVETPDPAKWPGDVVAAGAGPNASAWAADIVIATKPAQREDPCVAMRKHFSQPRK